MLALHDELAEIKTDIDSSRDGRPTEESETYTYIYIYIFTYCLSMTVD